MQPLQILPALSSRRNGGNLHVCLGRAPDAAVLEDLAGLLGSWQGGRLFLDVRALDRVPPESARALREVLSASPVPPKSVYFKGEPGFGLAGTGNRVIVMKKKSDRGSAAPEARARFAARPCGCRRGCGGGCAGCRHGESGDIPAGGAGTAA